MFGYANLFLWLLLSQFLVHETTQSIPGGYWGSIKSKLMSGLLVNGKRGHSAPAFAHMPCCMLVLSLTFSSSSELTLCSPHDEIFTFTSLSLLYTLSEILH
jgi:hypothetical protein